MIACTNFAQVKEALDYLSFLPPKSAEGFLKAIQVLVQCLFGFFFFQSCKVVILIMS